MESHPTTVSNPDIDEEHGRPINWDAHLKIGFVCLVSMRNDLPLVDVRLKRNLKFLMEAVLEAAVGKEVGLEITEFKVDPRTTRP